MPNLIHKAAPHKNMQIPLNAKQQLSLLQPKG